MPDATKTKVITLICERSVDLSQHLEQDHKLKDDPNVEVVKYPCSGMIQPLMVEAAMKAGASGVIICGCQIGDCYYREGNKMIRERLLGERPPGLKKTVDRRRVIGLWLSKPQTGRFISEAKEFVALVGKLNSDEGPPKVEPPKPVPAAKPPAEEPKPAADKPTQPAAQPPKEEAEPAAKEERKAGAEVPKPAADKPTQPAAQPPKEEAKPAPETKEPAAKEERKPVAEAKTTPSKDEKTPATDTKKATSSKEKATQEKKTEEMSKF